ncbi:M48 family metallopeptidase [Pseudomarimonas arenosa]|uniref:M48 family metallopeptidase n=1 Tax=Pseudomarimonas arenosa TaxID=2774145 RepID=A0AAW3ZKZ5_9GAMM|nr:SprT family zinc-dependent metalloprotease [Pseudomarimonas arenosa]MBD8526633.1 M48 family metallopeptidase [Pseudomarimonas arenosa]
MKRQVQVRELAGAVDESGAPLQVRWVVEPRARRLRLTVSEAGARLTLPPGVSERQAESFVEQHRGWLSQQWQLHRPPQLPGLRERDHLPLRGETRPIVWREARFARIQLADATVCIEAPAGFSEQRLGRLLADFYQAQARADLGRWLPALLPGLPRVPQRFRLHPLRSLWGALNPGGTLSLDLALILAPDDAYRYVLVHELCHLIQPNHSPAFWREVEARFGDWRPQRRWLRQHGLALKQELAALLGNL